MISVLGDRLAGCGSQYGRTEPIHLDATVVDVELRGNVSTGSMQYASQGVTHGGPAGVTQVQWAGGVGRDELDIDPLAGQHGEPPVILALLHDGRGQGTLRRGVQADVDEARTGNLRGGDTCRGGDTRGEKFGDRDRRQPSGLGECQRQVGRIVTMITGLRSVNLDDLPGWEHPMPGHVRVPPGPDARNRQHPRGSRSERSQRAPGHSPSMLKAGKALSAPPF